MTDNKHGYKAYDPGLVCRGYQYEEGKTYKKNGHGVCVGGVTHYCVNPFDVLDHYPLVHEDGKFSEFTTVEAIDEPVTDDGRKFATSTIKIGVKLGFAGFVKACIDFVYEKTIKNMPSDKVETGYSAQIGSSGDYAKIGSSGNSAQIGSSGDSAKIGSSGSYAQIGSSGYSAKIGSSGDSAKIGSSGDSAQIGSSGDSAKIGSSGDYAKIGSSGDSAKIGSSGYSAQIGSSGGFAQIGSSGDSAKIGSSGSYAQIGSSGDSAKIGSSGYSAQIGSSGDYAKIGSSGSYAKIGSSGSYAQIGSSGNSAQIDISGNTSVGAAIGINSIIKGAVGNWITLAEWAYDSDKQRCAPVCVKSAQIDGEIIKADTWYKLADGEFAEVADE
jgi:hypothetical protein